MQNSSSSFLKVYAAMFLKPASAFRQLGSLQQRMRYGFLAFLVPGLGYTLFYVMAWYAGGSPSAFKPWLALPVEKYFMYDIFLTLPGYFFSWTVATAVVHLLAKKLKGSGTWDDTLVILGFGIGTATWSSMLHDLIDAALAFAGLIDMQQYEQMLNEATFWRYLLLTLYAIYFAWFMLLFTLGIRQVQRLSTCKSIILAFVGLVVFQGVLLIFIR